MSSNRSSLVGMVVSLIGIVAGCAHAPVTPVDHAAFVELGEVDGDALLRAARSRLQEERGFTLSRSNVGYAALFAETGWMERDPFADERARDVRAARSRVLIRGQRRSGGMYEAVVEGENEIRTDSIPAWHTAPVSPSFRAWLTEIAHELREEASR